LQGEKIAYEISDPKADIEDTKCLKI